MEEDTEIGIARRRRKMSLDREAITRVFPSPAVDDKAAMRLLSDEEIAAHLERTLEGRPGIEEGLWIFAYGSLMWNPELDFAERRMATIRGWHRSFCLWQWRYRGSRDKPGLMLALDRGGSCKGLAYRIAGPAVRLKIARVWRREMIGNGYRPRWVRAWCDNRAVAAIAFIANRRGERYAGKLPEAEVADRIAAACGHVGPNAAYLLETVASCEALGIHDRRLWRMQEMVAERLCRNGIGNPAE